MPDCWATGPAQRKKAGIPAALKFATKPDLAIAQVRAIIERGVRVAGVAANEVYGRSGGFRGTVREAMGILRGENLVITIQSRERSSGARYPAACQTRGSKYAQACGWARRSTLMMVTRSSPTRYMIR